VSARAPRAVPWSVPVAATVDPLQAWWTSLGLVLDSLGSAWRLGASAGEALLSSVSWPALAAQPGQRRADPTPAAGARVALLACAHDPIGAAIAARLAGAGYIVVVCVPPAAAPTEGRQAGDTAPIELEGDPSDPESCRRLAAAVLARWGRIDVLVNGVACTDSDGSAALDATFNVTKSVIDAMLVRGYGRIVTVLPPASPAAPLPEDLMPARAGLLGFCRALAREVADRGVTVNMISPGVVRAANDTDPAAVIARIPARRLTEPGDIAAAVGFLVAEDSGYITGSDLAVNGGLSMY